MSEMYRTAFTVDPRQMAAVTDFLSTIKSYNVDWDAVAGDRFRVQFMHVGSAVPAVVRFITQKVRAFDVSWPVRAVEVTRASRSELINNLNFGNKREVTTEDLRQILIAAGRSPSSTNYLSMQLRAAGKIKYMGGPTTGRYEVIHKNKVKKRKAAPKTGKKE